MLQNGKLVARVVCVLVRRAALALCVVSCCARCGVFARCRLAVPASGWAGPQIVNYLGDAPMHYLWAPIRPFIGGAHTVWRVFEHSQDLNARLKSCEGGGA